MYWTYAEIWQSCAVSHGSVLKALMECHTITVSLCMRRPEKVEIELSDNLCSPFLLCGCSQGEKRLLIDGGHPCAGWGMKVLHFTEDKTPSQHNCHNEFSSFFLGFPGFKWSRPSFDPWCKLSEQFKSNHLLKKNKSVAFTLVEKMTVS